ncbi:uncharacterized protein LOC125052927 [Pieris napi]|uniref:uncharacterized protein LOC125052927 n=1 Tax=Pieris napi TaxID=78633 RepID=UPI001FB953D7|nr:uncharacterized protein LOC125052927 [Pieris napi]
MAHKVLGCILLLALFSEGKEKSRWSRQLSSYTADISDWVPLPGPVDQEPQQIRRQAIAEPRILSEPFPGFARSNGFGQEEFPPRPLFNSQPNRQLYLQAVPSAPQNYLSDQGFGQGLKFGLTQPNFPFSQGFVSPNFNFDGIPQIKARPPVISPVKFDNFAKPIQPQAKPFLGLPAKPKLESPKFVDGYRVENNSEIGMKKKAPTLQKVKFESFEKLKESTVQSKPKSEREEVQLLYVPVESLNRGQFNFRSPLTSAQAVNTDFYNQNPRVPPLRQNLAAEFQRPLQKPLESYNSQEALNDFNRQLIGFERESSKFSTLTSPFPTVSSTTPQPKKLKPHQPPLAIFLSPENKQDSVKVGDVLLSLKSADTVPVLDSVNPLNAPKVFIGPSNLTPPENFVKFDLPYLSNIENIDKKLRQLPFFVAPLSYSTPQGFAKIPFPSPHVGSVVINSQIRDSPKAPSPQTFPDSYNVPYVRQQPQVYQQYQTQNTGTQKPQISYYSTVAPKPITPPVNNQNYYSIEQQTVSTLAPQPTPKEPSQNVQSSVKPEAYFLGNYRDQYNSNQYVNFPSEVHQQFPQPAQAYNIPPHVETTTTPRTTVSTTTKSSSTYPSQLLETHNPYSINHAFHFNTPVDYQNFFEEYKEPKVTPGATSPPATESATIPSTERNVVQTQSSKGKYSQNYIKNYSPEIHYESEIHSRRPIYNTKEYTTNIQNELITPTERNVQKPKDSFYKNEEVVENNNAAQIYKESVESKEAEDVNKQAPTISDYTSESTPEVYESAKIQTSQYGLYDTNYSNENIQQTESSSTTTTTTTTTRRTPLRTRGRPRYTTARQDSNDYTTRPTVTRRPYRERRPAQTKSRYEPNRISTEKAIKDESDTTEGTSKVTRTRGRIHYRPTAGDDNSEKHSKQKDDLAYQRDILHQNYPVTLMERTSTVDIEAITEPTAKQQITNSVDDFKTYDTENAYTNDKLSITERDPATPELTKETDTPKESSVELESPFVHVDQINENEDFVYQARSSVAPSAYGYEEVKEQPSEDYKLQQTDQVYATSPVSPVTEQNIPNYSANNEYSTEQEETATFQDVEATKLSLVQTEEKVVETTPSYNRVRVRPSLVRQYHQVSSTESSRIKTERRKPTQQPITYRPAFDRRRTTMRIEEIEADLKTKPVHSRPEYDNHKHPVYKPELSTEATLQSQTTEAGNKRGQFRRRRPVYTTTSTEPASRRPYEVKNRFRGRRPTDKPTDKPEVQTEISATSTSTGPLYNRYNHRTKLSERFNKKPEQEVAITEDQESNYSINRPKYASPESDKWSPKISKDSFKPYNPNELEDDTKPETKHVEDELDIITARNEYEDILISVTPATNKNNRVNKKIADIPPTLEAYVEQSKVSKTEASDPSSTFETMLEEVMKSLEEQDEDEYTNKVMKHKGGEIGEIPPEKIISSGVNYSLKSTTPVQEETTTTAYQTTTTEEQTQENFELESNPSNRRRGFWKKVKVRPLTESFEVAESQYYPNTVNTLGQSISKTLDKSGENTKKKIKVTTYKPSYQFIKDFFENEEDIYDVSPDIDIPRINATHQLKAHAEKLIQITTESTTSKETSASSVNPGDMDWGTGSPDPTFEDASLYTEATQPTIDRSDGFSFMEYLFGMTSDDEVQRKREIEEVITKSPDPETEATKGTTETYIPDEITAEKMTETSATEIQRNTTETSIEMENSSISSFMNPSNIISTSMSTEVSHETEICFRGKCIKTKKDLL